MKNFLIILTILIISGCQTTRNRVPATPLNSCYGEAKSEGTSCIMMYWGNAAGQSQCRNWQRNHEKLCYNLYKNPKPITQKIANCINRANNQKLTCNLLNYGKPVGLQNCTRSKFRSIEHCYYINQ